MQPKPFNWYTATTTIRVFLSLDFAVIVQQVSQLASLEGKEHMFLSKEVTPGKTEKVDLISQLSLRYMYIKTYINALLMYENIYIPFLAAYAS